MLKPGMRVQIKRKYKHPAVVEIDRFDSRGFWIGFKIVNGRIDRSWLRLFKSKDVTAVMTECGLRCIFQEVL
ncbi:hypothetical protein [Desulfovibrio gilichinskyi]|uniref:Uncharacterized protein n=1 Tax=Desulfovibrio gilichinskyi TaxID=1519643 RepID=A0A1X7CIE9_9BACT|nr:hypothetical protein [Desulfovibrio gilichinskyi]SME96914.1 hypothetical protein SAMN06295933_0922 [Desulfovibrio gilichinskyi]